MAICKSSVLVISILGIYCYFEEWTYSTDILIKDCLSPFA